MSLEFSQYPLLQRVYDEQEDRARRSGLTPVECTDTLKRCIKIIENTIDRPAAEKEGVMVCCFLELTGLFRSPDYSDVEHFATGYTPQIKEFVDSVFQGPGFEARKKNIDAVQADAVLCVAPQELFTANLKKGILPEGWSIQILARALQDMKDHMPAPSALLTATAPRLATAYQDAAKSIEEAGEIYLTAHPSTPKTATPKKRAGHGPTV